MLKDWWNGSAATPAAAGASDDGAKQAATSSAAESRRESIDHDLPAVRELTSEERQAQRDDDLRRKLMDEAGDGGRHMAGPGGNLTYEALGRSMNRIFMDQCQESEYLHEGVQLAVSRHVHNMQVQSKWQVGSPQSAAWDVSLQVNGFNDVTAASWSTSGRSSLMHQRMFKSGAQAVMQFMMQPQAAAMGGPPGTFYGSLQYPWIRAGVTQLTYLRGQHVSLSHAARLVRGLNAGANLTYDVNLHGTTLAYAMQAGSREGPNGNWVFTVNPDSGEWKLGASKMDWSSDMEMAVQLDVTEKRNGIVPMLNIAVKKGFIGGGVLTAMLSGFARLKAVLELPFGGDRFGLNQLKLAYAVQLDVRSGAAKHGLTLTM